METLPVELREIILRDNITIDKNYSNVLLTCKEWYNLLTSTTNYRNARERSLIWNYDKSLLKSRINDLMEKNSIQIFKNNSLVIRGDKHVREGCVLDLHIEYCEYMIGIYIVSNHNMKSFICKLYRHKNDRYYDNMKRILTLHPEFRDYREGIKTLVSRITCLLRDNYIIY